MSDASELHQRTYAQRQDLRRGDHAGFPHHEAQRLDAAVETALWEMVSALKCLERYERGDSERDYKQRRVVDEAVKEYRRAKDDLDAFNARILAAVKGQP